ncbi:efflux RND transporter permease subunit [Parapedobacter koreensis]|uniref:Hydrophobic/amphiphilic exporter-1, HAE1 family n=1 Tax=Parapedobacter koreensis TaxID=332977 RepID=A0A1H7PHT9_9SPHI|nr:efflux RND transporter permease subunit [Parapedobacter koreensis]SEL35014.1 hydrophobic/amphiphilic exporter-1, HAE1 family [Parapedobacter koreensis]
MLETFIKRPVLSLVISLLITLLGILALFTLPVTQFPDIVPPSVVVTANYTGANAEVCTDAVAIPLERAINGVAGMTYMTSVSTNNGTTLIQVFFKVGTDPDIAAVNVQNRVTTVLDELPEEVIKAGVTTEKEVNSMLMYLNVFSDDPTADERFIYNFTDINILKELKRIEGVGFAQIMGARDYAMRVWLKPDRMAAYDISSEEVIAALRAQNVEAAPGQTGIGSDQRVNMQQYVLRYPGKFSEPDQYRNVPIRANADGSILRIRDIADVEFGSLDYEMESRTDGRPSASIMMKQLPGSNAQEVIENVKQRMTELQETSFPPGMKYTVSYDVSRFLDASISEVIRTLVEAFLLVFLVVFIFLQDFRSTLIPALAVPVCLIGALFFMQLLGFSINLLTLFALVLAIGIVVDNAIVVVEAVHVKMEEEHLPPMEATLAAMKEIGGAVVAITLVMSAVFIPVAFLSGPVGIFYRQFSLTLAASIVISGINALTLTPALCALILKSPHDKAAPKGWLAAFFKRFNNWYNRIAMRYAGLIGKIAGRRTVTLGLLVAFFIATWGANSILPAGFIPTEDQGMIYINVTTPPGATVDRTIAVLNQVDSISRQHEAVETVSTLAGYSIVTEVSGASYGMGMINLKAWEDRKASVDDVIAWLDEHTDHLMDASIEYFPPPTVPGFGNSSGFELRLLDRSGADDLNRTADVLSDFMMALEEAPEVGNAFSTFDPRFPQYLIEVDYDIAAKKGISVENAMLTLQTLMGSFYATNFIRFGQMYKVMVQAGPGYREKPEDVLKLYVKNDSGEMVPYSSFVTMERIYGPEQVTRYNMFAAALISGDAAPGYSSGQVIEAVERVAAATLPQGYGIEWSGMTREQILSGNQAIYVFALCLLFVYLILAAQYESFLLPLPVILSLPAGVFGAFLFLKLLGLENNIYAQVALVMLIGLLGKNAILIVEYAILRHKQGATQLQAAIEGSAARLRPILMTSFAFVAGLIPLAMASGAGALGNRSIGTTAVGGMVVGTLIGVMVIPGLYVLFASSKKKKIKVGTAGLVVIGCLILLSSCSTNKQLPDYQHRTLPVSYHGNTDTANTAYVSWRNFFNDPNLVDLIDTALANNPDMEKALHQVEIARANLRLRKASLFPSVDALAEAGLRKYGFYTMDGIGNYDTNFSDNLDEDEKLPDPLPDYFIGLRTSWEIDLWGKLKNQKRAAYQRFLASYEGRKLIQTALIEEVTLAYYDLLALDNELTILRKNIGLQEEALAIINVQKDAGRADELGVQQFNAVVHNSKGKEQEVLQQITAAENHLNFLLGRFHGGIARDTAGWMTDAFTDSLVAGIPTQLIALRPDVRQAQLELLASDADMKASKAAFLPSLVLSPYVGFQAFAIDKFLMAPTSIAYGLLGGFIAPVFNQRAIRSAYEAASAEYGMAFQDYEKTVLNAWKEVQTNLKAQDYINQRRAHNIQEVNALLMAVDAANELFKAGRATYLDIITAQRNVLDAEINLVQTRREKAITKLSLYKALGGGWQ